MLSQPNLNNTTYKVTTQIERKKFFVTPERHRHQKSTVKHASMTKNSNIQNQDNSLPQVGTFRRVQQLNSTTDGFSKSPHISAIKQRRRHSAKKSNNNNNNNETTKLQNRYEKLMNFNYTKQLDEIQDNIKRIDKQQIRKSLAPKRRVMFTEEVFDFSQK